MKTQENVVSASTFPLCPPLCTPRPPFVNHFSPFRATFLVFFSASLVNLRMKARIQGKSSGNPQVGHRNAPIPIGAHRQPPRSRGFTPATPHSDTHVRWYRGDSPRYLCHLGCNHSSCSDFIGTNFSHSLSISRKDAINNEAFDVSTNWRPRSGSSHSSTSIDHPRDFRKRRC